MNTVQATSGVGPYVTAGGDANKPPKKYVKIDGVMQLNPEYKAWKARQGEQATTAKNPEKALPVVTNMDDHMELNEVSQAADGTSIPLSPATDTTIEMMQEDDITDEVGLSSESMVDELGRIFAKYEVPMGLMNKLMMLSEYNALEFIVDDSGSMTLESDTTDSFGRTQTRWQEAWSRVKSMVEVLAYVPTPVIRIGFLNRERIVEFKHSGETPEKFLERAYKQIDDEFRNGPMGGTPALTALEKSFKRGAGQRVVRYFFGDGRPSGGDMEVKRIEDLVCKRNDPEGNPLTFMSCTNQDREVEWMKELEEVAPYCAEYDDFNDEAEEVRRDQGDALPYTMGFHLIGQLVGAMNPEDLDAMDESVPFPKWVLDNLLGIQTNEKEYRHYFNEFKVAQNKRSPDSKADKIKKEQNWEKDFHEFLTVKRADDIASVREFKKKLKKANKK